jgi:hypothetical protein
MGGLASSSLPMELVSGCHIAASDMTHFIPLHVGVFRQFLYASYAFLSESPSFTRLGSHQRDCTDV